MTGCYLLTRMFRGFSTIYKGYSVVFAVHLLFEADPTSELKEGPGGTCVIPFLDRLDEVRSILGGHPGTLTIQYNGSYKCAEYRMHLDSRMEARLYVTCSLRTVELLGY